MDRETGKPKYHEVSIKRHLLALHNELGHESFLKLTSRDFCAKLAQKLKEEPDIMKMYYGEMIDKIALSIATEEQKKPSSMTLAEMLEQQRQTNTANKQQSQQKKRKREDDQTETMTTTTTTATTSKTENGSEKTKNPKQESSDQKRPKADRVTVELKDGDFITVEHKRSKKKDETNKSLPPVVVRFSHKKGKNEIAVDINNNKNNKTKSVNISPNSLKKLFRPSIREVLIHAIETLSPPQKKSSEKKKDE